MTKEKELDKYIREFKEKGFSVKEFMDKIVKDDLKKFNTLTEWSDKDFEEYTELLDKAKRISRKRESDIKTKEVGDILEKLVEFLIKRSYFFDVITNIRTRTNEIDLYITRSDEGKQAIEKYGISEELLVIPDNDFIAECKNYDKNIGATWFGKFYAVMKTCDCNFGILFSLKRATGNFENWSDSYGLIRTLTLIEKYEYKKDFYLIDFGLSDFEAIGNGVTFFDIIKTKKIALKTGTNYDSLIKNLQNQLDKEQQLKLSEIKKTI